MVGQKTIAKKPTKMKQQQSPDKKVKASKGNAPSGATKLFLTENYQDQYYSNFAKRKLANSRKVDINSFDENNCDFVREWFNFQEWEWLVDQEIPVYPNLVHLFCTHFDEANKKPAEIHTWIKGKKIKLDANTLGNIRGIPSLGIQIPFNQTWGKFEGISNTVCSKYLLEDSESLLKRPSVDELPLKSRLLLLMLQSTFIARRGRKSSLTARGMKTMYCILKSKKINMPLFMIKYMNSARNSKRKCCLPYGMWLTLVFKHFDVSFTNEVELESSNTPFTIRTITIGLRYGYDTDAGVWKHLGVRRAPKRKAVDDVVTENDLGEKSKDVCEYGHDDSYLFMRRAVLESLVVQEMLKRLHPDYFTIESVADIRVNAFQHMTVQDNVQNAEDKSDDNENAGRPSDDDDDEVDEDEEEDEMDGGGGNYEILDEEN